MLVSIGSAVNVPFVFDENSNDLASCYSVGDLERIHAASPYVANVPSIYSASSEDDVIHAMTVGGRSFAHLKQITQRELEDIFNSRVEPDNPDVRGEALRLAAQYPGYLSIDQICSVYEYMKWGSDHSKGWSYVQDPRGKDYYGYANETLNVGKKSGCSGAGDCDDFAILMSALIEAVGGTTRIVLAYDESVGHAYTEVYLGQIDQENKPVETIIIWLRQKYNVKEIYTHIDSETKEVWLNLDWGEDIEGDSHPGGKLFEGSEHVIVSIRDEYDKIPLNAPERFNPYTEIKSDTGDKSQVESVVKPQEYSPPITRTSLVNVDAEDLIEQGMSLHENGKLEDAIECYDMAIDIDPLSYPAWELKGLALKGLNDYEGAIDCFDQAINIDPSLDFAWRDEGEVFYAIGCYQDAVYCFEKAVEWNNCGSYWGMMGDALMALGRHADASHAFSQEQALGANCS